MDLQTFERRARAVWEAIPASFREGISAFVVEAGEGTQDTALGTDLIYGCCEDDPVMAMLPTDEVRSIVRVFYGSFVVFASEDPDFDWEAELAETIRHEVEHHLGARAGHDPRADEDMAEIEHGKMLEGMPFTPGYHRAGVPLGDGAYLLHDELLVEVWVPYREWERLAEHGWSHRWRDVTLVVAPLGEVPQDGVLYADAEVRTEEEVVWPWKEALLVLQRRSWWWPW